MTPPGAAAAARLPAHVVGTNPTGRPGGTLRVPVAYKPVSMDAARSLSAWPGLARWIEGNERAWLPVQGTVRGTSIP